MPTVRKAATNMTLFTLASTDFITAIKDASMHIEVKDEDAAGVADLYEYAWAVKANWHIELDAFAETIAALMPLVGTAIQAVFNTGAGTYTGKVLVGSGVHDCKRDSLQSQKVTLKGQGTPTLS